jgi:nitroimidazol reductase NimA-like FMN-containing flavoprotein (pyridoxamine 5'-phosphate oxidase superfamily)
MLSTTTQPKEAAMDQRVLDLSPDECWELAASQPVGRLGWAGAHGITMIPVNFAVTGDEVLVRTTAHSGAARECDDSAVAFEVDHVDASTRSGWSVLVRGTAHLEYGAPQDAEPDVWAPCPRSVRLRIVVADVTGRRITPA